MQCDSACNPKRGELARAADTGLRDFYSVQAAPQRSVTQKVVASLSETSTASVLAPVLLLRDVPSPLSFAGSSIEALKSHGIDDCYPWHDRL